MPVGEAEVVAAPVDLGLQRGLIVLAVLAWHGQCGVVAVIVAAAAAAIVDDNFGF